MHLYIITRGIKNWVDQFITELQGKYVPFRFRDPKDNQIKDCMAQVAVRPIQLWEIVFPEDCKDVMLTTILDKTYMTQKGYGGGLLTQHKKHEKFIWGLRKMLGIKPIQEFNRNNALPICRNHVEVVGIGIKKDRWYNDKGETSDEKKDGFTEGL